MAAQDIRDTTAGVVRLPSVDEQGFEILSDISRIEIIAAGSGIRCGTGRVTRAELHWYEAHGIGKRDLKIKRYIE
jgi:hypothetical protein